MSTLLRRCLRTKPIKQTIVVTGGGEDALKLLSDLLGQCGRIGSNLNQLARHFNSGGKDSEEIRAQLLTELSALTLFRLDAEKRWENCMATIKHTSSKNSDLTAPEHYLTFQHNEYTGLPFWMRTASPSCGRSTYWTPWNAAGSPLPWPACWQTGSTERTSLLTM